MFYQNGMLEQLAVERAIWDAANVEEKDKCRDMENVFDINPMSTKDRDKRIVAGAHNRMDAKITASSYLKKRTLADQHGSAESWSLKTDPSILLSKSTSKNKN